MPSPLHTLGCDLVSIFALVLLVWLPTTVLCAQLFYGYHSMESSVQCPDVFPPRRLRLVDAVIHLYINVGAVIVDLRRNESRSARYYDTQL